LFHNQQKIKQKENMEAKKKEAGEK